MAFCTSVIIFLGVVSILANYMISILLILFALMIFLTSVENTIE